MGAPKSRGLSPVRYRELPATPPKLEGVWTVHVSFKEAGYFAISFEVRHTVNNKTVVKRRVPVSILSALRTQLLHTHGQFWLQAGLPVNPTWETDTKVSVGPHRATSRFEYVALLKVNFDLLCSQLQLPVTMVVPTKPKKDNDAAASTTPQLATKTTTGVAPKKPTKKAQSAPKKTTVKKAQPASKKPAAKKAVSPKRRKR